MPSFSINGCIDFYNATGVCMSNFNVLVVDDSEFDRELCVHLLELMPEKPRCLQAESCKQARGIVANHHDIQCFILDLTLPDGQGSDLIAEFEKIYPDAAIIMLTGDAELKTAMDCIQLGADDYLIKGEFNAKNFHRTIQYALERRQAAKQRLELQEALFREKALNDVQQHVMTLVAHEFKTPLAIISGATQLLEASQEKTAVFSRQYNKIMQAISRLDGLMNNVLLLSKLEEDAQSALAGFLYNESVGNACVLAQESNENRITFIHAMPLLLSGKAELFEYALANLISNALKYSPVTEQVQIETIIGAKHVTCLISDKGGGFSADMLTCIGDRFMRGNHKLEVSGLGLGLFLAIRFAEYSGGAVYICSEEGVGTKAVLQWPLGE